MRPTVIAFCLVASGALAIPAVGQDCTSLSSDQIGSALKSHSPFKGWWRMGSYGGPILLDFRQVAGVDYVVRTSSDERGRMLRPGEYVVSIKPGGDIYFSVGSAGDYTLSLDSDCELSGTQHHPNGSIPTELDPSSDPSIGSSSPAVMQFGSESELNSYLLDRSPFSGTWTWADREAKILVAFETNGTNLTANTTFHSSRGEITSYTKPGRNALTPPHSVR